MRIDLVNGFLASFYPLFSIWDSFVPLDSQEVPHQLWLKVCSFFVPVSLEEEISSTKSKSSSLSIGLQKGSLVFKRALLKMRKITGEKIHPCFTPLLILNGSLPPLDHITGTVLIKSFYNFPWNSKGLHGWPKTTLPSLKFQEQITEDDVSQYPILLKFSVFFSKPECLSWTFWSISPLFQSLGIYSFSHIDVTRGWRQWNLNLPSFIVSY